MRRQRPGHRILSFHHRGLLLLAAAVAVMLFFLYGCVAGAAYSPRGRLVFIPLAQVSGSRTTSLFSAQNFYGTIKTDEAGTLDFSGVPAFFVTTVLIVQCSAAPNVHSFEPYLISSTVAFSSSKVL